MVEDKHIKLFQVMLLKWFQSEGRHFPWREKDKTPYQLVIAEILLQRTKAETVAAFYNKFIQAFPSWESLSRASLEEMENYLKPIGLYRQRARRLLALANEMIIRKGKFPKNRDELESIPFMGQYIANSILLLIHKQPNPLLDVNMSRVLERYFGSRKLADIRYDPYLQDLAYKIANHKKSKEVNWAILDFAALICKARKPRCQICILRNECVNINLNKS